MGTWIMGVAPCSFPIIQKGRKDGGEDDGARRLLESFVQLELELGPRRGTPGCARAHHHYFMPVPDKSLRRLLG